VLVRGSESDPSQSFFSISLSFGKEKGRRFPCAPSLMFLVLELSLSEFLVFLTTLDASDGEDHQTE
jgi:hypothetical protein